MRVLWMSLGLLMAWFWWARLWDAVRGFRSVADISREAWDRTPSPAPKVSIVVPGRNEAEHVESCLRSLLALDYPNYEVIAVDDRSTDETGAVMNHVASSSGSSVPLRVLHIAQLPAGWMGKQHAMWKGTAHAAGDWLLFTDADVTFRSDVLRRAVSYAETVRCDHLVLFPSYELSFDEKVFMAGFQMLFILGHRPWKVADPQAPDWIGLGPFNMIRRRTYVTLGGWERLRMDVIEDMKLGKLVKSGRMSQHNVYGPGLVPWRWGRGFTGLSRNLTKNMFALLAFRYGKASGALALLLSIFYLPLAGAIFAPDWVKLPFFVALACLLGLYIGMGRRTPVGTWTFLLYPFSILMIALTLVRSMAHTFVNKGVVWRGTKYSLEELRKGWV